MTLEELRHKIFDISPDAIECINAAIDERDALKERVAELEAELATECTRLKDQLSAFQKSEFNPDWSLLQATKEAVNEANKRIKDLESTVERCKRLAETWVKDLESIKKSPAYSEYEYEVWEGFANELLAAISMSAMPTQE